MTDKETAARAFEQALIDLREATDFRGRKIRLGPASVGVPRSTEFQEHIAHFTRHLDGGVFFDEDPKTYIRNLLLLVHGWKAAVEYEEVSK